MMKLLPLVFLLVASSVSGQTVIGTAFRLNTGPCTETSGSGSPEGSVTGKACDVWKQTNSPYDIWRKVSGTGNTGWVKDTNGTGALLSGTGTSGNLAQWTSADTLGNGPAASNVPLLSAINTFATTQIVGGAVLVRGLTAPPVGSGLELFYTGGIAHVDAYNRTGAAWLPLDLSALDTRIASNGTNRHQFHASGGFSVGGLVDPGTNNLSLGANAMPATAYFSNLGSLQKKYLTLHAAELWVETLVAQNTIATIGGRVLVAPTNILTVDLAPATTTITVKYNNLFNGDRVYMEADGKVEWFAVASTAGGGAGAYLYTVTRDQDGSGANQWYAGDAVLNTGAIGNGFIDLYSVAGVLSGAGPTIVGNVRTASAYASIEPRWAIGNLDGLYGYSGSVYGAAFGQFSATNVTVDATNGFRIRSGTTNKFQADTSGNLSIVGDLSVGTAGVIRSGATAFGTGTGYWLAYNAGTPQFRVGTAAGNRMSWDGTDLTLVSAGLTIGATGVSLGTGSSLSSGATAYGTGTGYWLAYNAGTPQFRVGTTAGNRVSWDGTNLTLKSDTVTIDTNGIQIEAPVSEELTYERDQGFTFGEPTNFPGPSYGLYANVTDLASYRALNLVNHVSTAGDDARITIGARGGTSATRDAFLSLSSSTGSASTAFIAADGITFFGEALAAGTAVVTVDGTITASNLLSGTYTPTLTAVANVAASTAYSCTYSRVGSAVTGSCYFEVDPTTTATRTRIGISLPVASNFTTSVQGAGAGSTFGTAAPQGGALSTDPTNDRLEYDFLASTAVNSGHTISFTYQVL